MNEDSPPHISVVVPTRNNEQGIIKTLRLLRSIFEIDDYEIIVIVDNSTDLTSQKAKWFSEYVDSRFIVLSITVGSKALSVAYGFRKCRGVIWGFIDSDLGDVDAKKADVVYDIRGMLKLITNGTTDCVIGDRSQQYRANKWRWRISQVFNLLVRGLYNLNLPDTQCGVKFMRREVGQKILEVSAFRGFEFDVEILSWMKWYGYRITPYPLTWDLSTSVDAIGAFFLVLFTGIPMGVNLVILRLRSLIMRINYQG